MHPSILLSAAGFLLALNINLSRVATAAGVNAIESAFWSTAGAGVVLAFASLASGNKPFSLRLQWFGLAAGTLSYAIPIAIVFSVAGHAGSTYASALHSIVPPLTLLIAVTWGLDRLQNRTLIGTCAGLLGVGAIMIEHVDIASRETAAWILFSLLAPAAIAFGNVLRTRFWPTGASAMDVAPLMLLNAGAMQAIFLLMTGAPPAFAGLSMNAASLLIAEVLVASAYYGLYFTLQHAAGPVYLNLVGHVALAFGAGMGVLLFGEPVSSRMLIGAALIVASIALVHSKHMHVVPSSSPKNHPRR